MPWASDLRKLWKEEDVLSGLRTLVLYFTFDGDTQYKYLALTDYEQTMLDAAKQNGFMGAAHTAMNEPTAMDWLDARPERFARGGSCYTNIPSLSVVAEKHYAFGLPVLALGVATNRAGVPWGFLACARKDFQRFRFIPATFAAQKAWRNAAAFLDAAMMLAPGSTELSHGTKLQGAAGCASAALAAG